MSWRSMFIEDDASWPGLGFNPAKGDLEAIDLLAKDVKAVGDELDELEELLTSIGERGGAWEGEAAERFSKKLGELPKYLRQGTDSMHDCSKALRTWHGKLDGFQKDAVRVEQDALEARKKADREVDQYNDMVRKWGGQTMPTEQAERVNAQMMTARSEVDRANDRLEELIREGERIHANWKDRAGEAERAILKASENHPPDLDFWSRVTDALKEGWRDFKEWLIDNADLLSTISSALAIAAIAVNAIPVVGQVASIVLAGASAVCAAGAMAGHWMDHARGGNTPLWKVGLDALGVVPVVGGVVKGTVAGIKAGAKIMPKIGDDIVKGIKEPISTKVIQGSLGKVFPTVANAAPETITMVTKGVAVVAGVGNMVFGDDSEPEATAAKNAKFQQTLAA